MATTKQVKGMAEQRKIEAISFSIKDLRFLQPLIDYYKLGGFANTPIRVENAIDSLIILIEQKP